MDLSFSENVVVMVCLFLDIMYRECIIVYFLLWFVLGFFILI